MYIGPILGILSISRAHSKQFIGEQNEAFAEIILTAERMGCAAFVFDPFDIDWIRNVVWGYRYNKNTGPEDWERHLFPMPTVIYNRIPNRTLENRTEVWSVLAKLNQKYGPRFFNPCFLDKWQTHTILFNNRQTRKYLPETYQLNNPGIIFEMMNRFDSVYLKPTASSLGNDILKISRNSREKYHFVHQSLNDGRREGIIDKLNEIVTELPPSDYFSDYLLQQGIPLARYKGKPFDLRLLIQKNRYGKWQRTGLAARIAGKGSITTHVFYGGTRRPATEVLTHAASKHGFSLKQIGNQLSKLESLIPKIIEDSHGRLFGELEMDLGIDIQGKVWFFEANSKPFRFDEKLIRAKSLVRLIHYVQFVDANHKLPNIRTAP